MQLLPNLMNLILHALFLLNASGLAATSSTTFRKITRNDIIHSHKGKLSKCPKPLAFSSDGTFKLLHITDLHYGEAEDLTWGPEQDRNSSRVVNSLLDFEKPGLVVFGGDQVTGENTFKHNSTEYTRKAVQAVGDRGFPFASTYGNHDNQVNLTHAQSLQTERRLYPTLSHPLRHRRPNLRSRQLLASHLETRGRRPSGEVPEAVVWVFDSRGGRDLNGGVVEDWIEPVVGQWVNDTAEAMLEIWGTMPKSLAFVHIPPHFALELQETLELPSEKFPGRNDDVPLSSQGSADPPYKNQDTPPHKLPYLPLPRPLAIFSGHDHGDAWCAASKKLGGGIGMCFGGHTGYGGYGAWERSGRVVEMRVGMEGADTWLRLERGGVEAKVHLGKGFGGK